MATALRAALRRPELLTLAQELESFTVAAGRVVPPARIGWLEAEPELAADPLALGKLREAACAEFARGDAAADTLAFDDLLGERGPQGRGRLPVLAAAAWQAQRASDVARSARLVQELEAALQRLQPTDLAHPEVADAVAAAALLAAARGGALPDFAA